MTTPSNNHPINPHSERWLQKVTEQSPTANITLLTKACQYAEQHQAEAKSPFTESTLAEGLEMADELLILGCDSPTLAAAIIYPTFFYKKLTVEQIHTAFDSAVTKLLQGVTQMENIGDIGIKDAALLGKNHIENLRQMLLAMVDDIRIILIKLAEQLIILGHLKNKPRELQQQIARQAMQLYAPLANRLGIGQIKWQMEDLAFRYLNPEEYQHISKALKIRRLDRDTFIHETIHILNKLFKELHVADINIAGRAKHIYSIYRKMQKKHVDFSAIYDTSAFRVLVPSIKDCYTALGIVHSKWPHIPSEFDDYIAKPKPNGYRSIHTVVIGPQDIHIEIQIRTFEIHNEAELGVAAHWKYKEGTSSTASYEEKINLLREVMDWQKEVSAEEPANKQLYAKLFKDRVYVFTPKGDIYDLKNGATPLDFAYLVHTEIGHRCRGAKVNGALVQLTHRLKTGDVVQIVTGKESHPSRDWMNPSLGYLKTTVALNKVRHWYKKESYEENLEIGQGLWEKAARREKIGKVNLEEIAHQFNLKNSHDLFAAFGSGDLTPNTVIHHIRPPAHPVAPPSEQHAHDELAKRAPARKKPSSQLYIMGMGNLLTQLAKCCKPIPGDDILGYITRGRGVSIHQRSCPNIQAALLTKTHRVMEVQWGDKQGAAYPVDILIEAHDRPGLMRDITNVVATENISVSGMNTRVDPTENVAYIHMTIEIKSLEPLTKIMTQLRQIADIFRVERK